MLKLSEMEIVQINRLRFDAVMLLIINAIEEMERNSIHQWDEIYPDQNTIISDIESGNLYSAVENHHIIGIITLNEEQSP